MKNLFMYIMTVTFVLYASVLASGADCTTGFACSIDELNQREVKLLKEFNYSVLNYFSKHAHEIDYSKGVYKISDYNDLFVFNTIV